MCLYGWNDSFASKIRKIAQKMASLFLFRTIRKEKIKIFEGSYCTLLLVKALFLLPVKALFS